MQPTRDTSPVRVLAPAVAQQVAAGEVVDRPASVVKELVENALDARASRIEVEIKDGGTSRIAVHDDGVGMGREDAANAVLRHATSKITSIPDLEAVSTLGFRGEALPSIASVSAFEMTSATSDGAATKVTVDGGAEPEISGASRAQGTSVIADRLFYNVPARREFLKSKKVERAAITETVTHLALAHPEVAFKLTDDYREQLSLPQANDLRERLAGIYGVAAARSFRSVEHESFPYKVTGYAALPSVSYTNRYACQTVSVNGRWVRGTALTRAIDDAYRGTLPAGRYSPVVLMIEIDQRKIDVNVHPTKQVVRFSDEPGVRRSVADAISLAIGSIKQPEPEQAAPAGDSDATGAASGATPASGGQDTLDSRPAAGNPQGGRQHQEQSQGRPQRGRQERENAHKIDAFQRRVRDASEPMRSSPGPAARAPGGTPGADGNGSGMDSARTGPASGPQQAPPEGSERGSLPDPAARVIGQFERGYILLEEPGALWIVDQHAAHERVLLDRLSAGEQVSVQQLLTPEVVELSATEAAEGRELLDELSVYGFEAEPFGPSSFRITGVISTLAERDIAGAFRRAMTVARGTESGPDREQQLLATVACKSAVKLGDRLSQQEMESLMKQWLTESELPATCPHGRSICYRLDSKEVARKLDRH